MRGEKKGKNDMIRKQIHINKTMCPLLSMMRNSYSLFLLLSFVDEFCACIYVLVGAMEKREK